MQANSPVAYQDFISTHRPKHRDPDGSDYEAYGEVQPVWTCTHHLIKLLVRTVEHNMTTTAASDLTTSGLDGQVEQGEAYTCTSTPTHIDMRMGIWTRQVEQGEAAKFLKRRSQGVELSRYEASLGHVDFEEALENASIKSLMTAAAIMIQMMSRMRKAKMRIAERKAQRELGLEGAPSGSAAAG